MSNNADLQQILKQLDAVNPANISVETLQEMLGAIEVQKGQLAERARKSEKMVVTACLLYTSPSPRDLSTSRMPSSA